MKTSFSCFFSEKVQVSGAYAAFASDKNHFLPLLIIPDMLELSLQTRF